MLGLEVRKMFQVWLVALGSAIFLLALIVVAFRVDARRADRETRKRAEVIPEPQERPKAA
jgi:uncharacterized membrane protein